MEIEVKYQNIIEEVINASKEIPFGNSKYQNLNFMLADQITPARALRSCLLRLNDRINALRECYYSLRLEDIDIEEMQEKIESEETGKFEKRRLEIKIEQKKVNRISTEKMINDCKVEINTLYNAYKKLPKQDRNTFEEEEHEHFTLKLSRDLELGMQFGGQKGTATSLDNIGISSKEKLQELRNNPGSLKSIINQNQRLILGESDE